MHPFTYWPTICNGIGVIRMIKISWSRSGIRLELGNGRLKKGDSYDNYGNSGCVRSGERQR